MISDIDEGGLFLGNLFLVVSNAAFLLAAIPCFRSKKYLAGIVFISVCIVSSIYHTCKWGSEDEEGFGGYCPSGASVRTLYAMDFFCSHMAVPVVAVFFINPKKALVNVEERYRKSFETHALETTRSEISGEGKFRGGAANDSCSERKIAFLETERASYQTKKNSHPSEIVISSESAAMAGLESITSPPPIISRISTEGAWRLFHYDPNSKVLKVLDSQGSTVSHSRGDEKEAGHCLYDHRNSEAIGGNDFLLVGGMVTNRKTSAISPGEKEQQQRQRSQMGEEEIIGNPELWCRTCETKVKIYQRWKSSSSAEIKIETDCHLGHKLACLDGLCYCSVGPAKKRTLFALETVYLLYHAFALSCCIKTVGPSFYHVTLPLVIFNVSFVLLLLIHSYLTERRRGAEAGLEGYRKADLLLPRRTLFGTDVSKSVQWSLGIHRLEHRKLFGKKGNYFYPDVSDYKKIYLTLSLLMGALAVILFATQNVGNPDGRYEWTHSIWHILGGVGMYVLLELVL